MLAVIAGSALGIRSVIQTFYMFVAWISLSQGKNCTEAHADQSLRWTQIMVGGDGGQDGHMPGANFFCLHFVIWGSLWKDRILSLRSIFPFYSKHFSTGLGVQESKLADNCHGATE